MVFKKWIILGASSVILPVAAVSCQNTKEEKSAEKVQLEESIQRALLMLKHDRLEYVLFEKLNGKIVAAEAVLNNSASTNENYKNANSELVDYYTKELVKEKEELEKSKSVKTGEEFSTLLIKLTEKPAVVEETVKTEPISSDVEAKLEAVKSALLTASTYFDDAKSGEFYTLLDERTRLGQTQPGEKEEVYYDYSKNVVKLIVSMEGQEQPVKELTTLSIKPVTRDNKIQLTSPEEVDGHHTAGNPNSTLKFTYDSITHMLKLYFKIAYRNKTNDYSVISNNGDAFVLSLELTKPEHVPFVEEVDRSAEQQNDNQLYAKISNPATLFDAELKKQIAAIYKGAGSKTVAFRYDYSAKQIFANIGKNTQEARTKTIDFLPENYQVVGPNSKNPGKGYPGTQLGGKLNKETNVLTLSYRLAEVRGKDDWEFKNKEDGQAGTIVIDLSAEMNENTDVSDSVDNNTPADSNPNPETTPQPAPQTDPQPAPQTDPQPATNPDPEPAPQPAANTDTVNENEAFSSLPFSVSESMFSTTEPTIKSKHFSFLSEYSSKQEDFIAYYALSSKKTSAYLRFSKKTSKGNEFLDIAKIGEGTIFNDTAKKFKLMNPDNVSQPFDSNEKKTPVKIISLTETEAKKYTLVVEFSAVLVEDNSVAHVFKENGTNKTFRVTFVITEKE